MVAVSDATSLTSEMNDRLIAVQKSMALLFVNNLEFFKNTLPSVYEKFRDYDPEEIAIRLSSAGYLDLYNVKNKKSVYPYDPQEFCEKYLDDYSKSPVISRLSLNPASVSDEENDIHISTANAAIFLIDEYLKKVRSVKPLSADINLCILNGLGPGYILSGLLERAEIRHLIILEPHSDFFYFSMHLLDWQQVFDRFAGENKNIQIILDEDPERCFQKVRLGLSRKGIARTGCLHVVDHLSSKKMQAVTEEIVKRLPGFVSSLGFADDEQWSLAHTIKNIERKVPVLSKFVTEFKSEKELPLLARKTAFVVANGPSVDEAEAIIKKYREDIILISCGSALGTLRRMGIKPDIHLEVERRKVTAEWIEATTDAEYRKGIVYIGLNTIHPDSFDLFEHSYMALKPNDLGTHVASGMLKSGHAIVNLPLCNPTVGNMGISVAGSLGFRKVYVIGFDMAYGEDGAHHSRKSDYYKFKEKKQGLSIKYDPAILTVKGNFSAEVPTTVLMGLGIQVASDCAQAFAEYGVKYYKVGGGAFVEGMIPTSIDDIAVESSIENIDVHDMVAEYFDEAAFSFSLKDILISNLREKIKQYIEDNMRILSGQIGSATDVFDIFEKQHEILLDFGRSGLGQHIYTLFKGSVQYWGVILDIAAHLEDWESGENKIFHPVMEKYLEFWERISLKLETDLLEIDYVKRVDKSSFN